MNLQWMKKISIEGGLLLSTFYFCLNLTIIFIAKNVMYHNLGNNI